MDELELVYRTVRQHAQEYIENNDSLVDYLSILFCANEVEKRHSEKVCELTVKTGFKMGYSKESLEHLAIASIVHDIGKVYISPLFLYKADTLSQLERYIVKQHVILGSYLLLDVGVDSQVVDIVSTHHEKTNGKGYPKKISSAKISKESQLLTVADIYDALVSERCYKKSLSVDEALTILQEDEGLNQDIVKCLSSIVVN